MSIGLARTPSALKMAGSSRLRAVLLGVIWLVMMTSLGRASFSLTVIPILSLTALEPSCAVTSTQMVASPALTAVSTPLS